MTEDQQDKSPLREIVQPFIDLIRAPRALWGINLPYFLEGFAYWGVLGYLAMYFNQYVGLGDVEAGWMVGVLTAGITISMFFLGGLADKWGVRTTILIAFVFLIAGRVLLPLAPTVMTHSSGMWSSVHLVAMAGIVLVLLGYGMYQPAAYAAVKQFTTEKTAAMAFAMLYALMNLGGFLPAFMTPVRSRYGITGAFWCYTGVTVAALLMTYAILSRRTVREAIERTRAEKGEPISEGGQSNGIAAPDETENDEPNEKASLPLLFWLIVWAALISAFFFAPRWLPAGGRYVGRIVPPVVVVGYWLLPGAWRNGIRYWLKNHPLANAKFAFFIFALIPVQTLFAHNWLTLPMYVERGYRESWPWISVNFEKAVNFNPLLIFILVPIVTALTQKRKVYNMMIVGTLVMAAPSFLLAFGAKPWTLVAYLVLMTVGEAMWQPRFLQYAAEIAPEGRTGAYMGVAQFPWFLTKVIVPLYSGWFLKQYCPAEGDRQTGTMWLIYACIAMASTVLLIVAKGWVGKDFKTKAG